MAITIDKRGRRIEVRSADPLTGMKTTIPGAYLNATGIWTVPLSLESCKLLRQKFGYRLTIGSELRRWARGVVVNRQQMAKLAASKTAPLKHLRDAAPKLYMAMRRRKYQRVGARFIADNSATLIADDPGLGKTLIAMGGILESQVPGPYLIVAPKTASDSVWRREIQRWLPRDHRAITVRDFRYQREKVLRLTRFTDRTWMIIHPEMLMVQSFLICQEMTYDGHSEGQEQPQPTGPCGVRTPEGQKQKRVLKCGHIKTKATQKKLLPSYPQLYDIEWGAVVIDESHEMLIRRSGVETQRRRGADMLRVRGDGLRIAMSGTPFDSKPHQLWGTLNWLDSATYSAYHRWSELYWQKGGYTGFQLGEFRRDREEMLWDSLSAIALRRTKAEVAPDLPPKTYVGTPLNPTDPDTPIGVWLEMDGKQAKAYADMEKLSVTELESGRLEAITALAELTRLKQFACAYGDLIEKKVRVTDEDGNRVWETKQKFVPKLPSNKFDWICESLEEWGFPKDPLTKVVIVSFYTGILELYAQALEKHFRTKPLNPMCTAITGNTPSNKRAAIIDRFNQSDNETVMMLNVKAGGTAITIDSADRMIFVSETRIPDQQQQAEDRIHRVSNPRKCMYYYLRSIGTVDVGTAIVNEQMKQDTHRLLDGRRGVEYMRNVLSLSH